MNCGTILYDRDFQFHNTGKTIDKLSIIVCESGDCHFALVTTTNPVGKGQTQGCQSSDKPPNYFIPKGSGWFNEDTWILLDALAELNNLVIDAKVQAKSLTCYENQITTLDLKQILQCAMLSPYMDGFDKEFIERSLNLIS
jgi:hypothetical protein